MINDKTERVMDSKRSDEGKNLRKTSLEGKNIEQKE